MKVNAEKIITITLNPAVDVHIDSQDVRSNTKSSGRVIRRDRGGKGINVSRTLFRHGYDNLCYILLGEDDAESFMSSEDMHGLRCMTALEHGGIRENYHIHTPDGDFVRGTHGAVPSNDMLERAERDILQRVTEGTYLVFSGSIPVGTDTERVISLLLAAKGRGARLILDCRSVDADEIKRLSPYMIKPNCEEAEALLGYKISGSADLSRALTDLKALGSEWVVLTLGADGIGMKNDRGEYAISACKIDPISTTGAGDSTVAAFVISRISGLNDGDTLRLMSAFGTAACMTDGSLPPDPCQIKLIFDALK